MIALSVVVLTRNEERNIKECLESVAGWAGEIVVIDDESTDRTVDIASNYTDKIITRRMEVEGSQRNFAYAQAKNLWVLSLDADERVTEELKAEIKSILSHHTQYNGFTIPRKNFIGDYWVRYGGWYPSPQLKLFRRDKFRYEEVGVHPRAFMDDPCGHLRADIIHYSYRDIADFLGKLNNQTTREAEKWFLQNKPMRILRFLYRSIDRFLRTYLGRKGYKDGFLGFVIAFYASLYQIISYLKYREMVLKHPALKDRPGVSSSTKGD